MRDIIKTTKAVIKTPTLFFKEITKEKSIKNAFIFFIIFYGITMAFSFVQTIVSMKTTPGLPQLFGYIMLPFSIMFTLAMSLGAIFFFTLIFHGFYKLFKGHGLYKDSFNLFVYSSVPSFILGLVMGIISAVVVIITGNPSAVWYVMLPAIPLYLTVYIWNAVLITIGGSILHRISRLHSFLAGVIIPMIVVLVILLFALLIAGIGLFAILSQTGQLPF